MNRKIIIKNKISDLEDRNILCKVYEFIVHTDILNQSDSNIITFGEYACYFERLKTGTLTFTFVDNVGANDKE